MDRKTEAYNHIRESIMSNALAPDEPISELAFSKALNISRTPIREALRELESEGLVVSYPSRGCFVASFSPYDIEEVYELRVLLEVWALERSLYRITNDEASELEAQFNKGFEENDWDALHRADRALHGLIIEKAGSKRLLERIRRISARSQDRRVRSYKEHLELIACIKRTDIQKSREVLTKHLRSVSDDAVEAAKFHLNNRF